MRVALIGNPNAGKTSIFNQLTGLNQKVGNYPGITVDKKEGKYTDAEGNTITILDLPGLYSVYPKSLDEEIVFRILADTQHSNRPDLVLVVVDASNLERNLLLFTQAIDLGLPCILALNMRDLALKNGIEINIAKLSELLGGIRIVETCARTGEGILELKAAIGTAAKSATQPFISGEFGKNWAVPSAAEQVQFSEARYRKIHQLLRFCVTGNPSGKDGGWPKNIDRIVTHPVSGYLVFLTILFVIFQAIFAWSEWPMELIDSVFVGMSQWTKSTFPAGALTNLMAEGIIPGLAGVLIFIPQIALLFGFIFLLEETGYMARVVFIMDRLMRPFGLNGRSVVPLISGIACAIPAVLATRTIDNWKERIITILVTPLMSCSARLPVYTLLIALVIPEVQLGIFNLKGLVLMALYLLGVVAALGIAAILKFLIQTKQRSYLIMELPTYKAPRWNNLWLTILEKVKIFVWEAGRVIMAISIVLWVGASYGPSGQIDEVIKKIPAPVASNPEDIVAYEKQVASVALENSYVGILGRGIEPVIRPLGYNWQIGIALITSFAAREVFVGSMATIYSVGEDFEEDSSLLERMRNETNSDGTLVYTLASGLSLMVFYAFAMQCMSTLAVVLRETKNIKWPLIQLGYMTGLAYISALLVYNLVN